MVLWLTQQPLVTGPDPGSTLRDAPSSWAVPPLPPAGARPRPGQDPQGPDLVPAAMPAAVAGPPLEEHLAQNTLWPEVSLAGHPAPRRMVGTARHTAHVMAGWGVVCAALVAIHHPAALHPAAPAQPEWAPGLRTAIFTAATAPRPPQSCTGPQVRKLYGHGNEVHCCAASPDGQQLASACRAQSAATATIWIWRVADWTPLQQLAAHTLTVTQVGRGTLSQQLW
jgi:hypothetical protein